LSPDNDFDLIDETPKEGSEDVNTDDALGGSGDSLDFGKDEFFMDDVNEDSSSDESDDDAQEDIQEDEVEATDKKQTKEIHVSPEDKAIQDAVINVLGEDVKLKVKGGEYNIKDLSADEIKTYLQKGLRANQVFNDNAAERRQLEEERNRFNRDVQLLNDYNSRIKSTGSDKRANQIDVPEFLKPNELDTDETRNLKQYIYDIQGQVSELRQGHDDSKVQRFENDLRNEIESCRHDYPAASLEEVVAVKLMQPDVKVEELMRISHEHYSSEDFIQSIFKSNPDTFRAIEDKIIADYNRKKATASQGSARRYSPRSDSGKISSAPRKTPDSWYDAEKLAHKYLETVRNLDE